MKRFRELLSELKEVKLPLLTQVVVKKLDGKTFLREDRKWKSGRFDRNIGIDRSTYGAGQAHAHIYARNGKDLVLIVNIDGSGSHGTKGKLHPNDADALRQNGF